ELCADEMVVARRADAVHELLNLQHAVVALDGLRGDAEQLRVSALLVAHNVAVGFAEEFVTGVAMDPHAKLIAHRPRRDEESGLLAQHPGDLFFESADCRVLAENVVTDVRGGHRGAHAGRGASYGIAAKVDRRLHHGFSFRGFLARMGELETY